MKTTFQPTGNKLLIRLDTPDRVTESGIHIPESAQPKPRTGTVLAVGDDVESGIVIPGARIAFSKYGGSEIDVAGESLLICSVDEVYGVYTSWK